MHYPTKKDTGEQLLRYSVITFVQNAAGQSAQIDKVAICHIGQQIRHSLLV